MKRKSDGWRGTFGSTVADTKLDAELSFHVDMATEAHIAAGLSPAEARRRALVEFGGTERYREAAMDIRRWRPLEDVKRDVRHGARSLLRSPVYTCAAVLSLALGIGAGTAVFTLADDILLQPLPYGSGDRLHTLYEARPEGGIRNPSYLTFEDWQEQLRTFDAITYIRGDEFRLRGDDGTQRLLAGYVSSDFFRTTGTAPQLGRAFGEDDVAQPNVVVLSHDLWQRRFAADPSVLGTAISTTDGVYTVVGVMPPGFRLPQWADVWAPLAALPAAGAYALQRRDMHVDAEVWGAIRPEVTPDQAREDLSRVVATLAEAYPDLAGWFTTAQLTSVRERVLGDTAGQLRIIGAAVLLLLLIVCVNVAGLQVARGSARQRELALRATLGAGRGRLVRQLLAESMLLAVAGGALGVLAAVYAVRGFAAAAPGALPRLDEVGIDARTLLVALGISLLCAVGFGVLPALRAVRGALSATLREGSSGAVMGGTRVRSGLVVAQVALALVMTVGSGLLLRSLWTLQDRDIGFSTENVMVLRAFPPSQYADADAAAALYRELHDAVARVPGVSRVALANHVPFAGGWMVTQFHTGAEPPATGSNVIVRTVSQEYFDVLGAQLIRGRLLEDADYRAVGSGIVINDALARRFFGADDPIGRTVSITHAAQGRPDFGEPIQATVVGVVAAERFFSLEQDPPAAVFVPYTWMVWGNISIIARTHGPPAALAPALRRAVQQVERDIPVAGPGRQAEWRALDEFVGRSLQQRRVMATLLSGFAGAALFLALLGIFGLTAYVVSRRTREIGVRVAIGASRFDVVRLVVGRAVVLAAIGVAIGLPASWAGTRLLQAELFGVTATDPATLAVASAVFIGAGVLAAALPALRALRIAPTEALRTE